MRPALRTAVELIAPGRIRHVEVPPMELGLTPNDLLDEAKPVQVIGDPHAAVAPIDDVVRCGDGGFAVARGHRVEFWGSAGRVDALTLPGRVTALAVADQVLAAVDGHGIYALGGDGPDPFATEEALRSCVTALLAHPRGGVLAAVGSTEHDLDSWAYDLFRRRATGLVLRLSDTGKIQHTRGGLAWPAGLALTDDGADVLISLAHRHRIDRIDPASLRPTGTFMTHLPAYPWRITPAARGRSYWLSLPLVRSAFTELLLQEDAFLADMMATVDRDSWYGPSMAGGSIFREPLQFGGLRALGRVKPWAPPRSYGLVAQVDATGRVLRSLHSRAGGTVHGVVAAVETADGLLVAARSRSELLTVALDENETTR
jgi:hypothetical protein